MYKEDVIGLCKLVTENFPIEMRFEFFEHAFDAVICPYSLLYIANECFQ